MEGKDAAASAEMTRAFHALRDLYAGARDTLSNQPTSVTRRKLLEPALDLLGFAPQAESKTTAGKAALQPFPGHPRGVSFTGRFFETRQSRLSFFAALRMTSSPRQFLSQKNLPVKGSTRARRLITPGQNFSITRVTRFTWSAPGGSIKRWRV